MRKKKDNALRCIDNANSYSKTTKQGALRKPREDIYFVGHKENAYTDENLDARYEAHLLSRVEENSSAVGANLKIVLQQEPQPFELAVQTTEESKMTYYNKDRSDFARELEAVTPVESRNMPYSF